MTKAKPFRHGIVAVFWDATQNKVLVGNRKGHRNAWQFPQGGIDPGETPTEALRREVGEELGCQDFIVLASVTEPIAYQFPKGVRWRVAKIYRGQLQHWFLCALLKDHPPDLSKATDEEFDAFAWVSPEDAVKMVVEWKRTAYAQGLQALRLQSSTSTS